MDKFPTAVILGGAGESKGAMLSVGFAFSPCADSSQSEAVSNQARILYLSFFLSCLLQTSTQTANSCLCLPGALLPPLLLHLLQATL